MQYVEVEIKSMSKATVRVINYAKEFVLGMSMFQDDANRRFWNLF